MMLLWLMVLNSLAFAHPYLYPRNQSDSALITTNIDITSSNGTKTILSNSSLRTLLYVPPSTTALSSLTGRAPQPRMLHHCRSPTASFHHSHCLHRPGQMGGMQRYIIYCREEGPIDRQHPHSPRPLGENGVCGIEEICVDSWIGDPRTGISLARCVPQEAFEELDARDSDSDGFGQGRRQGQNDGPAPMDTGDDSEEDDSGHIGGEKRRKLDHGFVLGGKQASVVVSQADALTPMEVNKIELNVIGKEQSTRMCQDCFELRTNDLAPNTTELNMQATLMSAGTFAAGVMWVALFSG